MIKLITKIYIFPLITFLTIFFIIKYYRYARRAQYVYYKHWMDIINETSQNWMKKNKGRLVIIRLTYDASMLILGWVTFYLIITNV